MPKNWYRLDTAALIFPAIARRDWSNAFRLSVCLKDDIDIKILQRAADSLKPRFPSFYVTLHRGFFWYYLEESSSPVQIREDYAYPLTFMSSRELKRNCVRILVFKNRIAAEFFHAVTDGYGGCAYLANLTARYLELKEGVSIPSEGIIRDLSDAPTQEELEDSFLKNAAKAAAGRDEAPSFRLRGSREERGFKTLTTGIADTSALMDAAHRYGVTLTALLAAVMAESIIAIQNETVPLRRRRPVMITLPVDMRRLYKSRTLRNFTLVINAGVDPRYGEYSLEELCQSIHHQIRTKVTPQNMAGMIAANVQPQQIVPLRLAPVFLKNLVMDAVYRKSGERGGCINISNITSLQLPEEMLPFIERMEFIIGPQRSYPNNCSVMSFGGKTYINMIRNIKESELERRFFSRLVELGIAVEIECNRS